VKRSAIWSRDAVLNRASTAEYRSATAYCQQKHRTDGPGQFYGLHIVGTMQRIHTTN
jgi:hypothetical protein